MVLRALQKLEQFFADHENCLKKWPVKLLKQCTAEYSQPRIPSAAEPQPRPSRGDEESIATKEPSSPEHFGCGFAALGNL
jgi:hypothetical protein